MPVHYIRRLTGAQHTASSNSHRGIALAFIAGAANAGGFLAVRQYTSHRTGIVSSMADNLVIDLHIIFPLSNATQRVHRVGCCVLVHHRELDR